MDRSTMYIFLIIASFLIFATIQSCGSTDSNGSSNDLISSFASSRSHNTGQNCMNCHITGGGGDGFFTVAGTVYEKNLNSVSPNSIVRLYATADGDSDHLMVIEVDSRGNFYTTESIDFADGLYTSVEGPTAEMFMESTITAGSCNNCHGNSTERIWAQ